MSTATSEQQQPARLSSMGSRPSEPEHLPCPRCDSTDTKFCYYNNYNLSQPRHFCKSCRRYWTRGGTLRNVPVGGGSRKSTSGQKRPRINNSASGPTTPTSAASSSSEIVVHELQNNPNLVHMVNQMGPGSDSGSMTTGSFAACFDVNLNEAVPEALSLSSLLTNHAGPGSYMPFGLGFGLDSGSGLNGVGFGLGSKWVDWPMESVVCQTSNDGGGGGGGDGADGGSGGGVGGGSGGSPPGCNTWQMGGVEGGLGDDGDCFGWPDLAISMTGKGLK